MNPIRLHILEREIESLCTLALETADELESRAPGADDADAAVLAQAVAHLALKISYLLWRFGRRASDRYASAEADHLLGRLGLGEASPLAPNHMAPFGDLLTMSSGELLRSVDASMMTVTVRGVTRSLRPVVAALARVAAELGVESASHRPMAGGTVVG
ncbi:MAG TPA: hypothetical protein VF092_25445 [Longimicrobium sp.]